LKKDVGIVLAYKEGRGEKEGGERNRDIHGKKIVHGVQQKKKGGTPALPEQKNYWEKSKGERFTSAPKKKKNFCKGVRSVLRNGAPPGKKTQKRVTRTCPQEGRILEPQGGKKNTPAVRGNRSHKKGGLDLETGARGKRGGLRRLAKKKKRKKKDSSLGVKGETNKGYRKRGG